MSWVDSYLMRRTMKTAKALPDIASAPHLTAWPVSMQISRCRQKATLQDISSKGLSDLVCNGWHCNLNPEFNCLSVNLVAGQRKSLCHWIKKFSMLGHEHCILVQLPKTEVLLYRPVCTQASEDYLCFHYLNRIYRPWKQFTFNKESYHGQEET